MYFFSTKDLIPSQFWTEKIIRIRPVNSRAASQLKRTAIHNLAIYYEPFNITVNMQISIYRGFQAGLRIRIRLLFWEAGSGFPGVKIQEAFRGSKWSSWGSENQWSRIRITLMRCGFRIRSALKWKVGSRYALKWKTGAESATIFLSNYLFFKGTFIKLSVLKYVTGTVVISFMMPTWE